MKIRRSQIEKIEALYAENAELRDEIQSFADDLAEARQTIESLRAQLLRLHADRQMAL